MTSIEPYLLLAAFLFCLGLFIVMTRRHAILLLLGIELILNAANLNLIAFNRFVGLSEGLDGQVLSLFVIVLAACEVVVALALVLAIYRQNTEINIDTLGDLRE